MQWFILRPTFEISIAETRSEVIEKLRTYAARHRGDVTFQMFGEYGELHLPSEEHRLWSPHLSFYVAEREPKSLIHGRFAPRLDVWTFVWIVYLAMAFTAFFGAVLAYSQWVVEESPWGIYVTILGCLTIAAIYCIAHVGQQWSSDQMQALRDQLDRRLLEAGVQVSPALATSASKLAPA